MFSGKEEIEVIFQALSEQLAEVGAEKLEMVVCGGAALNVLGYIRRTTQDVDVIAFARKDEKGKILLTKADLLPPDLLKAAERVQKDFNLPEKWLNTGPSFIMDFGLPQQTGHTDVAEKI